MISTRWAGLGLLIGTLAACGNTYSGGCNICPGAVSYSSDICYSEVAAASCEDGGFTTLTNNACGSPDGGLNFTCFFYNCSATVDCSKVVDYNPSGN